MVMTPAQSNSCCACSGNQLFSTLSRAVDVSATADGENPNRESIKSLTFYSNSVSVKLMPWRMSRIIIISADECRRPACGRQATRLSPLWRHRSCQCHSANIHPGIAFSLMCADVDFGKRVCLWLFFSVQNYLFGLFLCFRWAFLNIRLGVKFLVRNKNIILLVKCNIYL